MGRKKEEIDEKTKNLTYPKTRKPKKTGNISKIFGNPSTYLEFQRDFRLFLNKDRNSSKVSVLRVLRELRRFQRTSISRKLVLSNYICTEVPQCVKEVLKFLEHIYVKTNLFKLFDIQFFREGLASPLWARFVLKTP